MESALLKHYQLDDLGNSHHVKSNDIKLKENDNNIERTTEIPHNYHQNNKHLQKHLLGNNDEQNEKLRVPQKRNHIANPPTPFEETKHETIPPKNDDNENFNHPRFAYLNHKENSTEVKIFPIEVKPVNPYHYRNPIVKPHPHAKYPDNILADEKQKSAVPFPSLGSTDDNYPIEPQHPKIYENSSLKDKEDTLYDHDVPAHEQHSKKQPELKQYADKKYPENDNIPTIKHSKIANHSKPTDQIIIDNPVDKSGEASTHGINKSKDSFNDVTSLLFYSDTTDVKKYPEVAKPTIDTNNGDVVIDPIVPQKEIPEKISITEIDKLTKDNKIDDKKQSIDETVSDNDDKRQKAESKPRTTLHKDIAKPLIEGSPLNADSPTDDGPSTEQNDDCTSDEIDPNINGDDEEAAGNNLLDEFSSLFTIIVHLVPIMYILPTTNCNNFSDSENIANAVLLSSVDLWEKLFSKEPNTEFQAFNVLTLSPIVDKTSRLFAFPNQTTVEESVETVWACKGGKFVDYTLLILM